MASTEGWIQLTEEAVQVGYHLVSNATIHLTNRGASDPKVIAFALLSRTVSHLKAIKLLHASNLIVEARTLVRNCFENSFRLAALVEDRDAFVKELVHEDNYSRKALAQFALDRGADDLEVEKKEALASFLRIINLKDAKTLSPKGVSKKGLFSSAYLFYLFLSMDAHPTLHTLSRYLATIEKAGSKVSCLTVEQTEKPNDADTLNWACQAALSVYICVYEIWGPSAAGERLLGLRNSFCNLAGISLADETSI